ncbi:hypothetical protein [uncultured Pluralibacter sp.]|uniref:hypothetical protein n=1 Tax=uncultured Pluralibacter sp. TaxID=1490864 RepID=UPI00261C4051|nr:hypothetical protein [uncultured Pluralibacter sp.]
MPSVMHFASAGSGEMTKAADIAIARFFTFIKCPFVFAIINMLDIKNFINRYFISFIAPEHSPFLDWIVAQKSTVTSLICIEIWTLTDYSK